MKQIRRRGIRLLAACASLAMTACDTPSSFAHEETSQARRSPNNASDSPPNFLFIIVDDLRPELGAYGSPVAITPNIDNFAKTAMLFENSFVSQALCSPSRASMLSGLRPDSTGIHDNATPVDRLFDRAQSMPDLFKSGGYTTAAFGKVYHFHGPDKDAWVDYRPPAPDPWMPNRKATESTVRWTDQATLGDTINVQRAKAQMRVFGKSKSPFFMAVGLRRPHFPFAAPSQDWNRYNDRPLIKPVNPGGQILAPKWALRSGQIWTYRDLAPYKGKLPLPASKADELRWGYLACVSYVDGLVGGLLHQLEQSNLTDNTVVIIWGDNGFKLEDHGHWGKASNTKFDTRVPLIVRAPGLTQPGARTDAIVEAVDIFPTLAEIAGLSPPVTVEGTSFAPLMASPNRNWKAAAFSQNPRQNTRHGPLMGYTVRTVDYRYTAWVNSKNAVVAQELYDLKNDPDERVNVALNPNQAQTLETLEQARKNGWKEVARKLVASERLGES